LLRHRFSLREICEIGDAGLLAERIQQFQPDLILLDWELPGLEVARIAGIRSQGIRNQLPRPGGGPLVIVMSIHAENEPWALASSADAFLNKLASGEVVYDLLRRFISED
jgi:CheY-like chemotaxis protein